MHYFLLFSLCIYMQSDFFRYLTKRGSRMILPWSSEEYVFRELNSDHKKMLKTSDLPRWRFIRGGRITESQCLTTSGFRRSEFDVFFFLSFIILGKGRVTSATGIVPFFNRKIIVQWRSGIYPTYISDLEIALGIVQTYRDVLSCKRSRMRKKKCVDENHRSVTTPRIVRASQNLSNFYHVILFFVSVFLWCIT